MKQVPNLMNCVKYLYSINQLYNYMFKLTVIFMFVKHSEI